MCMAVSVSLVRCATLSQTWRSHRGSSGLPLLRPQLQLSPLVFWRWIVVVYPSLAVLSAALPACKYFRLFFAPRYRGRFDVYARG